MRVIQYSRDAGAGIEKPRRTGYPACAGYDDRVQRCDQHVIASAAKQSIYRRVQPWIASLRSQWRG